MPPKPNFKRYKQQQKHHYADIIMGFYQGGGGGGGVLHYICLIGMCRYKGVWTLPILVSIWVRYSREFKSRERVCRLNGQIEREIE